MSVSEFKHLYTLSESIFGTAHNLIARSGVAPMIDEFGREGRSQGGRRPRGITYTTTAVLTAATTLVLLGRPPSIRGILVAILDFTDEQLSSVGMTIGTADCERARGDYELEYQRFHSWLTRRLAPLDSGADLPARRVTNRNHRATLAQRSTQERQRSAAAMERARIVVNAILAASVHEKAPAGSRGDVVVDETTLDLAGRSAGLGSRPDKHRAAAYVGAYYMRDQQVVVDDSTNSDGPPPKATLIAKQAFGVGVTAVIRVGNPDALHSLAPVVTGVDIHHPTSASVAGLTNALRFHRDNGFDNRPGGRARWPYLTVDMGYNPKDDFDTLMLETEYAAVARYPSHWNVVSAAVTPTGAPVFPALGPVQISGAWYCPAAAALVEHQTPTHSGTTKKLKKPTMVVRTRDLLADNGWRGHDDKLAAVLPLLMGLNSRPKTSRIRPGRPTSGAVDEKSVKIDLVWPAVQRRVRCRLKPESVDRASLDAPTVDPPWEASERTCCAKSSVTVTLTPDQLRMAQWDLVPGSWEHTLYFEAARAMTEQRFGFLKSRHITGVSDLKWSPRREPMIKIIIAIAFAVANIRSEEGHRKNQVESIRKRKLRLAADLGHHPTRTPPRT